jgi:hypothetical protein
MTITQIPQRNFWLRIEAKWITLARNAEHVERTSNFLAQSK